MGRRPRPHLVEGLPKPTLAAGPAVSDLGAARSLVPISASSQSGGCRRKANPLEDGAALQCRTCAGNRSQSFPEAVAFEKPPKAHMHHEVMSKPQRTPPRRSSVGPLLATCR